MRPRIFKTAKAEFGSRSGRLLLIAALLGIGGIARPPLETEITVEDTDVSAAYSPERADSIMKMIAVPPKPTVSAVSRRSYLRSAQIQLAVKELRERMLLLPLPGITARDLRDSFDDLRGDGSRFHRAIDIEAPQGTPVLAVDDGRVLKLHDGGDGGISLYATDARERFVYFYAHLDGYHAAIREGTRLARGDTIGYVGTTGNAPPDTPHLHFAVVRASNIARWSRGTPLNPVEIFR